MQGFKFYGLRMFWGFRGLGVLDCGLQFSSFFFLGGGSKGLPSSANHLALIQHPEAKPMNPATGQVLVYIYISTSLSLYIYIEY